MWQRATTFEKGRSNIWHTSIPEINSLGPGNVLFFVLLVQVLYALQCNLSSRARARLWAPQRYMGILMVIMSIIAVPLFNFASNGNGLLKYDDIRK